MGCLKASGVVDVLVERDEQELEMMLRRAREDWRRAREQLRLAEVAGIQIREALDRKRSAAS